MRGGNMTHEEFVALVKSMRDAQKTYFKTRRFSDMELSKNLERQVDAAIKEIRHPERQAKLFDEKSIETIYPHEIHH